MVTKSRGKSAKKGKKSVASIVVDRLLEKIDEASGSTLFWQKPYKSGCMNWYSGRSYTGINIFLLMGGSGEFITFNQLREYNKSNKSNYKIEKGTRSHIVLFNQVSKKLISEKMAQDLIKKGYGNYVEKDKEGNFYQVRFTWRYYNVFDIEDIKNSDGDSLPSKLEQNTDKTEHKKAADVIKTYMENSGVSFREDNSNTPYYTPVGDYISLPSKKRYKNNASYYSVIFHELVHSTGIKDRLNRKCFYAYHKKKEERGREELIAEVGASLLMTRCDENLNEVIFNNSLNYVGGWCSWMADNPEEVLRGMMNAEKAVEYILNGGSKADKTSNKDEKPKKDLNTVVTELLEASNRNKERGKKTWDRIYNSGKYVNFINNPNSDDKSEDKFNIEKFVNGEPLLSLNLSGNMRLVCGMTFCLIVNEKDEFKLLYSIERGSTILEAEKHSFNLKVECLQELVFYMNLRRRIV